MLKYRRLLRLYMEFVNRGEIDVREPQSNDVREPQSNDVREPQSNDVLESPKPNFITEEDWEELKQVAREAGYAATRTQETEGKTHHLGRRRIKSAGPGN